MPKIDGKRCRKCGHPKIKDDFKKDPRNKDGLSSWCRNCFNTYQNERAKIRRRDPATRKAIRNYVRKYQKAYLRKHPDYIWERTLKRKFGFTSEDYQNEVARFNGVCSWCSNEETTVHYISGKVIRIALICQTFIDENGKKESTCLGLICRKCCRKGMIKRFKETHHIDDDARPVERRSPRRSLGAKAKPGDWL